MGDDDSLKMNKRSRLHVAEDEAEGIDRISGLSDKLIHHILSHLGAQVAVQLCILSKRWKYVWKTLPFLDFTNYKPHFMSNLTQTEFVERFLSIRNHQHDILDMKLCSESNFKFVTYAIRHNVQKLDVDLTRDDVPVIKLFTFSSYSLKELRLNMNYQSMELSESDCWHLPALTNLNLSLYNFSIGRKVRKSYKLPESCLIRLSPSLQTLSLFGFKLPNSITFPALTNLNLTACILPTQFWDLPALLNLTLSVPFSKDLSELFPALVNLRNLTLFFQTDIEADFLIKCPQLVNLKISTPIISPSVKIIVLAPKIRSFSSDGFFAITFGDSELENINVRLERDTRYKDIAPSNKLKNYYRQVEEMFVGLGSARILTLDLETIKALTVVQDVLVDSPSPFYNLKYVKIPTSSKESCISDCLKRYLLGCCPDALIVTTLPQNDLIARSKVASVIAQRVAPQEPLSAPAKVLIDSGNIPSSVDIGVQEEHLVQNSVIHAEGKGSDQTKASKRDLDTYTIQGTNKTVTVGDCVLMKNSEPDKPPFVACIEKLEADGKGNIQVRVRWYYRPEEAGGGRRAFHGVKELFLSDQYDTQSAHTIEGKCTVHSFKDYAKLEDVGVKDYYSRFEYHAATRSFTPDRVAVYCKCEMPYNPDDLMIKCDECKDWYHPRCVKMTTDQAQQLSNYLCDVCSPQQDGKKPNVQNDLIARSKVASVRAQRVAPQEPLSAPAKVLIDSGNIPRSVDMGVQEEHVVQNSVLHAEGKGSDQVISSTGNRDFGVWRGYEVNSEFVCLLDLIIRKYPETFRNFTAKSKMVYAMKLNMLCTSINNFTKISLTEVTTEMIAEYRNIFADLQDLGFNLSWLVCRLNYIEQLCLSQPLIPQLHAIDCHIGDAKNNLKDLESRVNDAKIKLEDLHTLRAVKMQEIQKAFGPMGANLAVGNIGDHLFTTNP